VRGVIHRKQTIGLSRFIVAIMIHFVSTHSERYTHINFILNKTGKDAIPAISVSRQAHFLLRV